MIQANKLFEIRYSRNFKEPWVTARGATIYVIVWVINVKCDRYDGFLR